MNFLRSILNLLISLRWRWLVIYFLIVISSILEQYLMQKLEIALRGDESSGSGQLFLYGGLNFLNGIVFPLLTTFIILWTFVQKNKKPISTDPSLGESVSVEAPQAWDLFNQYIIENLRSWGKMIWWGLLFILPGIYKYISYSYVPFIVMFDPHYHEGHKDALKESEILFRHHKVKTIAFLLIFQIILPLMLSSLLDSYRNFKETPGLALLMTGLQGAVSVLGFLGLYHIYHQSQKPLLIS